jgi:hypothetical protein
MEKIDRLLEQIKIESKKSAMIDIIDDMTDDGIDVWNQLKKSFGKKEAARIVMNLMQYAVDDNAISAKRFSDEKCIKENLIQMTTSDCSIVILDTPRNIFLELSKK